MKNILCRFGLHAWRVEMVKFQPKPYDIVRCARCGEIVVREWSEADFAIRNPQPALVKGGQGHSDEETADAGLIAFVCFTAVGLIVLVAVVALV